MSRAKRYHFFCRSCLRRLKVEEESFMKVGKCQFCYEHSQNETICVNCGRPAFEHRLRKISTHRVQILCPDKPGEFRDAA